MTEKLNLPVELTVKNTASIRSEFLELSKKNCGTISVDASLLQKVDETGLAFLYEINHTNTAVDLLGLRAEIRQLYDSVTYGFTPCPDPTVEKLDVLSQIGKDTVFFGNSIKDALTFIGEVCAALLNALHHPKEFRLKEILKVSMETGTNAVGIVCLIGFLMGIIIAFETALVAQIFGAVIFVVNGIGVALTRELGPLMTAILFAGRSGSAFAAQLGTQKVNEELNALTTFGLDPVHFLVVPRIVASTLILPLLSVFATLIGVLGGGLIMLMYDITFTQFYVQLIGATSVADVLFGIVKSAVFGFVISLIGCYCGLRTGAGAAAVGLSTTRAVVLSIVWIVLIDGTAALLMNRLGW